MKRFDLGMWMLIGTFTFGLSFIAFYITGLSMKLLYAYGYGNPMWFDILTAAVGPITFLCILLSLVVMYGGESPA